jgi:small ligand-binding sensory domain FIST
MLRAGVGLSVQSNPRTAAVEATQAALKQAGLRVADAALCFAGCALGGAFPLLVRTVAETAGTPQIAGCGSIGVIANGREIETGPSVAVLVFSSDTLQASRFFVPQLRQRGRQAAEELAALVRPKLGAANLLCLFPDTYNFEPDSFLATIRRELPSVTIVGGGATEDGSVGETFQFCGDVVSSNSMAAMLLSGDFEFSTGAALACTPLGRTHRVTAVRENVILELDDRSAYEVFSQAAGPLVADVRRALAFVFLGVPLDNGGEHLQRGNFYVRNIVGVSAEHGAIAVSHRPQVGDSVGFVLRDGERSRNELKVTLESLAMNAKNPPGFALYFDCVSRGSGLYSIPDHDVAYIGQYFARLPVAGFFTGFEIGPLGTGSGLLQYSGVLALVSERNG